MAENKSRGAEPAERRSDAGRGKRKKHTGRKVLFWIGTLCLVGILTAAIFVGIFLTYVNRSLKGHVEVDVSAYDASVSTELYYKDRETDEFVMYQTLFLDSENRIWVKLDQIPEALQKAAIAIEDKRFETHHGVDWIRTVGAIRYTLTGSAVQGGSTITQQMLKNATGDDQNTVKRKVIEIYRALAFEKEHDKDEIMEMYLNLIYMGESCYGVQTASDTYFGKDVSELSLAECASLIAITNNPSMYDPLISDWTRENNRRRQGDVLDAMLEQGKIDQAAYDAAVSEEVVFSDGYTILGNYVGERPQEETEQTDETPAPHAVNSYFTDQVIDDVIEALCRKYGYDKKTAEIRVFSGCKIYTTQNYAYQKICEDVFEHTDYTGYTDSDGVPLQAAITLMDPFTGEVLAMVGGTGTKPGDRIWNWATETRQCGSAIKPVSTYAPALDNGTITAASVIDDYPILLNGRPYPENASGSYGGLTTVQQAVARSLNTCAVRLNMEYGTAKSYNFMTENLGFTTLSVTDSQQVGNMALGGLTEGVTTEQMAAAYGAFINDGIYTKPYTFYRVEDANGKVLLENEIQSNVAMKQTTAYLMRELLQGVMGATGYEASFSGMDIGGKTGTTNDERDRYFVGITPYYSAAVWCGYESNERIHIYGNPAANLWRQVMSQVHAGLANPGFHSATGLTTVRVCADSGLLATEACTHDVRGDRTRSVTVAADTAPTEACTMHKMVKYCTEGKHIATEFCPADKVQETAVLDYDRDLIPVPGAQADDKGRIASISAPDNEYLLKILTGTEAEDTLLCPVHREVTSQKPTGIELYTVGENGELSRLTASTILTLPLNESREFTCRFQLPAVNGKQLPSSEKMQQCHWSLSNGSLATVTGTDISGCIVQPRAAGSATLVVTVKTDTGSEYTASVRLTFQSGGEGETP